MTNIRISQNQELFVKLLHACQYSVNPNSKQSTLYLTWEAFYLKAPALHCHDKHCIWHWTGPCMIHQYTMLHVTVPVYHPLYCTTAHNIAHTGQSYVLHHTISHWPLRDTIDTHLYYARCHPVSMHCTLYSVNYPVAHLTTCTINQTTRGSVRFATSHCTQLHNTAFCSFTLHYCCITHCTINKVTNAV